MSIQATAGNEKFFYIDKTTNIHRFLLHRLTISISKMNVSSPSASGHILADMPCENEHRNRDVVDDDDEEEHHVAVVTALESIAIHTQENPNSSSSSRMNFLVGKQGQRRTFGRRGNDEHEEMIPSSSTIEATTTTHRNTTTPRIPLDEDLLQLAKAATTTTTGGYSSSKSLYSENDSLWNVPEEQTDNDNDSENNDNDELSIGSSASVLSETDETGTTARAPKPSLESETSSSCEYDANADDTTPRDDSAAERVIPVDDCTTPVHSADGSKDHHPDEENLPNEENPPILVVDEEAVLASTEALYAQVTDKSTATVKDILQSLSVEFGTMDKSLKTAVKQRLQDLVQRDAHHQSDSDQDDPVGDEEESEEESEADVDDANDDDDEYTDDKEHKQSSRSRRHRSSNKEHPSSSKSDKKSSLRPKKQASKAKLAMRIHAEQRRKRRLEELKVRNEELMVHQSKIDQERAELIAAKFDTNTTDLRLARIEKRLDLLEKLDQTRLTIVQSADSCHRIQSEVGNQEEETKPAVVAKQEEEDTADETSSSEDEVELEIEGPQTSLQFNPNAQPKLGVLQLLDMADKRFFVRKKTSQSIASPGRARAALKLQLQQKRRDMGNRWLARELGYATEREHIQDCLKAEQKKRELILQREQQRILANERALLRERMLNADERQYLKGDEEEDENPNEIHRQTAEESGENNSDDDEEEENEELAMAKELEAEKSTSEEIDSSNDGELDLTTDEPTNYDSNVDHLKGSFPEESRNYVEASSDVSGENGMVWETQLPATAHMEAITNDNEIDSASPDNIVEQNQDSIQMEDEWTFETQPPTSSDFLPAVSNESIALEDKSKILGQCNTKMDASEKNEDAEDGDNDDETVASISKAKNHVKPNGPRNSAWQALLLKEKELLRKKKKNGLVEEEADEEEEEAVAGLEDFGFVVHKKKQDDEEDVDPEIDEEDLKHVVDDVSDDEGDEEAGEKARKLLEQKEEKERHKEIIRRMRDGYDGRRGGIAVGGTRGVHRFDELVAADNREDAKRLGLLNDDELESEDEENGKHDEDEEDEAALLDKMLKDRFLHRSSVEEEDFSEDEENQDRRPSEDAGVIAEDGEEKEQERLAKRFAKRARMNRLIDLYGHEEEFSQSKLIDEDESLKIELQRMKNGLERPRIVSSSNSSSSVNMLANRKNPIPFPLTTSLIQKGGSLALALKASRSNKMRTSFVREGSVGNTSHVASTSFQKCIAFNHVVFHSVDSRSGFSKSNSLNRNENESLMNAAKTGANNKRSASLFSKSVLSAGFAKKRKH
jgi:hypothetical protein